MDVSNSCDIKRATSAIPAASRPVATRSRCLLSYISMPRRITTALLMMFFCLSANAAIIVSTDPADFILTPEAFPTTALGTFANIVSTSGNITLDRVGVGAPATGAHGYTNFTSGLTGDEYVLNGDENFDVIFSSSQSAFAMTYFDDSIDSTFTLTFLIGGTSVGTSSFISTTPFDTAKFIGFVSDASFDKVQVRENDGSNNTNEFFQFFTATAAPEPATLVLLGLGLAGIGWRRDRR